MRTASLLSIIATTTLIGFGSVGCTTVQATLPDGTTIDVKTFAQSRQDIDIGRDADGNVHWKASNSSPDQTLTKAIADLVGIIAAAPKP